MKRATLILLFAWTVRSPATSSDWRESARKLGPSELSRQEHLEKVKRHPSLKSELESALNTDDRYLALEVIVALQMKDLLPRLLETARSDENGMVYTAINALIDERNAKAVLAEYQTRVVEDSVAFPVIVVLLDTLGRTLTSLGETQLLRFVQATEPEVRSAAVSYVRHYLIAGEHTTYRSVLRHAIRDPATQIRLQTLYAIQDGAPHAYASHSEILASCLSDKDHGVRQLCRRLRGQT